MKINGIDFEFLSAGELLRNFRWPLIIGLPYVVSLMTQYSPANWFTIPTVVLVVVLWVVAALSFIE